MEAADEELTTGALAFIDKARADGEAEWPRREFLYWSDDASVAALRYDAWKVTFLRQNALGLGVWQQPFEELRAPTLTNLRMDPIERAEEEKAMGYQRWYLERCS